MEATNTNLPPMPMGAGFSAVLTLVWVALPYNTNMKNQTTKPLTKEQWINHLKRIPSIYIWKAECPAVDPFLAVRQFTPARVPRVFQAN